MSDERQRWRLDDWMRPARGEHYTPRMVSGEVLPSYDRPRVRTRRRSLFSSLEDITAEERRSMARGLVLAVVGTAVFVWQVGVARGLTICAGPVLLGAVSAYQLYRSRHVGWRTEPSAEKPPAQTPTAPAP